MTRLKRSIVYPCLPRLFWCSVFCFQMTFWALVFCSLFVDPSVFKIAVCSGLCVDIEMPVNSHRFYFWCAEEAMGFAINSKNLNLP